MIKMSETKHVCSRCLQNIHDRLIFQDNGNYLCYPCAHELELRNRVTHAQNQGILLSERTRNGFKIYICPFCGSAVQGYGQIYTHIICEKCGAIYQFNERKFTGLIYDLHGKRYLRQIQKQTEVTENSKLLENKTDSEQKTNNKKLEDLGL